MGPVINLNAKILKTSIPMNSVKEKTTPSSIHIHTSNVCRVGLNICIIISI